MPKYYEEKEDDNRACAGIREDFKSCLLQHDCVLKEGKPPSECLKEGHCKALQVSFFECKRSMIASIGKVPKLKRLFGRSPNSIQDRDFEDERDIDQYQR